jgi:hypothetical protein
MDSTVRRMTDNMTLDTTIAEPSMTAGELEMLLFAMDRSRATFAWKCGGLDAAGLTMAHPPSRMTLGGLLKHLALMEYKYAPHAFAATRPTWRPWETVDFETESEWEWSTAADDSPEELYGIWRDAVTWCRATWAAALADGGLDQPESTGGDGESPNLRRILVDLHEEYARHVGHADLFREAVDGLVGEDPPQPR